MKRRRRYLTCLLEQTARRATATGLEGGSIPMTTILRQAMRWDHQWVSCEKDNAECKPLFQLHRTPPIFTVRVAWPVQKVSKKQQWDSQEARAAAGETRRRGERREENGE